MGRHRPAFTIAKRFEFAASHQLEGLDPAHPCSRLHGHNYTVEVVLRAEQLDAVGFVHDYRALAPVKRFLDTELDHQHLNQVLTARRFGTMRGEITLNPTAEWLAWWLYWTFAEELGVPHLHAVRVAETPGTWAEYRP